MSSRLRKVTNKLKELKGHGGLPAFFKGLLRYQNNRRMMMMFGFDAWHCSPLEWRPYTFEVIRLVNTICDDNSDTCLVEVGCGLGDMLGLAKAGKKFGYDISPEVLKAAGTRYPEIRFAEGSFDQVSEKEITVLISVNFIHLLPQDVLIAAYKKLIQEHGLQTIILDSTESKLYKYNHSPTEIAGKLDMAISFSSEKFNGGRRIHLLESRVSH